MLMCFAARLKTNLFVLTVIAALCCSGCGDRSKESKPIAGVNDSYLSEQEFLAITDSSVAPADRAGALQQWVKTEVLYQKAVEEGITNEPAFLTTAERAKKEIAATMLLDKMVSGKTFGVTREEIASYYDRNKPEFLLHAPSLRYHVCYTRDERVAEQFRTAALEVGWQNAQKHFEGRKDIQFFSSLLREEGDVESRALYFALKAIEPGEISLVLRTERGLFFTASLISAYAQGALIPFSDAAPEIEKRLSEKKKAAYLEKEIQALYTKSKITIAQPQRY